MIMDFLGEGFGMRRLRELVRTDRWGIFYICRQQLFGY